MFDGALPFLDLEYVVVTAGDGDNLSTLQEIIFDDISENITYTGSWDNSTNGLSPQYFLSTMHRTNLTSDSTTISFDGNAITVQSATSGNHGLYNISLDGGPPTTYSGSAPEFRSQMILVRGLSPPLD